MQTTPLPPSQPSRLRVVMVSKALVHGAYQRKAEEIARCGVDLTVLIPAAWADRRGRQPAEAIHTDGYSLQVAPVRFNGHFHIHYYPTLGRELDALQPDLLHMDEEPYNLATWHALAAARRRRIPATFFTWQNIRRRYPPPFNWMEQRCYAMAPLALAGSEEAANVLRTKGYRGAIRVFPQFGVDPAHFAPDPDPTPLPADGAATPFTLGYAGGLLPEKGVDLLLRACATLPDPWRLHLAGEGSERPALERLAGELGVDHRVRFVGRLSSQAMPDFYRGLHLFVLPSRTTPGWKEQFGRVLVEAMACGVPVVGSHSGEIPHVLGDAGVLFPEGDLPALAATLERLRADPVGRAQLGVAGRARVMAHFTMAAIARRTVLVYRELVEQAGVVERAIGRDASSCT